MKILVINGSTTPSVTEAIEKTAIQAALPGTEIRALTPAGGPAAVEGHLDSQLSAVGVCETIAAHQGQADAFVIASFSDPGLFAARELSEKPVVGLAEASMLTAFMLGYRFGLITAQRRMRPLLEGLVHTYGFRERLAGVRVVDASTVSLASPSRSRTEGFLKAALHSLVEDGAEVLIPAEVVFAGLDVELRRRLSAPLLDPVKCAVMQAQALVALGLKTSRECSFAPLPARPCPGCPPEIAALAYEQS